MRANETSETQTGQLYSGISANNKLVEEKPRNNNNTKRFKLLTLNGHTHKNTLRECGKLKTDGRHARVSLEELEGRRGVHGLNAGEDKLAGYNARHNKREVNGHAFCNHWHTAAAATAARRDTSATWRRLAVAAGATWRQRRAACSDSATHGMQSPRRICDLPPRPELSSPPVPFPTDQYAPRHLYCGSREPCAPWWWQAATQHTQVSQRAAARGRPAARSVWKQTSPHSPSPCPTPPGS